MGKPRKKYNAKKLAKQKVTGLIVSWSDTNPDMDTSGFMPGTVTHIKPLLRTLAPVLYAKNKQWIVEQEAFFWKVTMTAVFRYPNGSDQHETRELHAQIILADLSTVCEQQHQDMLRHGSGDHYSHTEFTVQCLGPHPIEIHDDDEDEAAA